MTSLNWHTSTCAVCGNPFRTNVPNAPTCMKKTCIRECRDRRRQAEIEAAERRKQHVFLPVGPCPCCGERFAHLHDLGKHLGVRK